jgi:serine/threonine-protein kinase RsbW
MSLQPKPVSATKPEAGADVVERVTIPSDPSEIGGIQDRIQRLLPSRASSEDRFGIQMAMEEALCNAIKHGNRWDRDKKVHVCYRVRADRFEAWVRDEGPGFDPSAVPDPTAHENLERPCGRGLMLMRHYLTEMSYSNRGNSVSMIKVFDHAAGTDEAQRTWDQIGVADAPVILCDGFESSPVL